MILKALILLDAAVLWFFTFGQSKPGETISAAACPAKEVLLAVAPK